MEKEDRRGGAAKWGYDVLGRGNQCLATRTDLDSL